MPSSQIIYGIVIMFSLNQNVTGANGGALFAIGFLAGIAGGMAVALLTLFVVPVLYCTLEERRL